MNTVRHLASACTLAALAALGACSSGPARNDPVLDAPTRAGYTAGYGTVSGIEVIPMSARTSGGGALLGAVIGGVLGNQVGGGSGRDAATVVGAVGGAIAGNQIEKRRQNDDDVYRVTVRLDNGASASFDYRRIDDLRVGDRVRVQDGQLYRA